LAAHVTRESIKQITITTILAFLISSSPFFVIVACIHNHKEASPDILADSQKRKCGLKYVMQIPKKKATAFPTLTIPSGY
jgi:hypothetical protein